MSFSELFKVFSKRTAPEAESTKPLTQSFKYRVLMRCRDLFPGPDFWDEIHLKLTYLHGRPRLADVSSDSNGMDILAFLDKCDDAHFLDFIECIFPTNSYWRASSRANLVEDLNEFLLQDALPYAITDFVTTQSHEGQYLTTATTAYPQVIRKDSEVLYRSAIQPTIQLLSQSEFNAANREFLEALEDFRKADYGDCLTKCGSAFESVLKAICARKKWPHGRSDTASPLLKTVVANSDLEPFFEQPLVLVATIRNKLSKSHGAGLDTRNVTKAKAEYAINSTAAAILLLVKETE